MQWVFVCFKENVLWWRYNIIFHLKRILKKLLLQVRKSIGTDYCQVQSWKDFVHVSAMHQTSFRGRTIPFTKTISYAHLKIEMLISGTWFGPWFLKDVSRGALSFTVLLECVKKEKKHRYQNVQFFSLHTTFIHRYDTNIYWYEHVYTCRRKEFLNILEIKLSNYFEQLLLIY